MTNGASSTFAATDGNGYELMMGRWSEQLAEPFLDFAGTRDGERVLDVGCGTGHLAQAVVSRCMPSEVCAIDLAPAYIDHAKSRNRNPRVSFDIGDACAMKFADHVFDRVLSLLVLHFVPQAAQAIAEMRRVAKPGAVVAACVWDVRGGFVANRIFFDTAAALDPKANERRARNYTRPMTTQGELASAWRAAGLHEVVEASLGIRMAFSSFEDYWAPYDGREGPAAEYVATLGSADRARLIDALRAAYLDGEPDGPRSYAALAWAVKGIAPA
jgi:ubiquinone/menaquinone biosynthesis C-methylase UbiE